jgi:hypothetical protein
LKYYKDFLLLESIAHNHGIQPMYIYFKLSSLIAFKMTYSTCSSTVALAPCSDDEIWPLSFLETVASPSLISTFTLLLASINGSWMKENKKDWMFLLFFLKTESTISQDFLKTPFS